MKIPLIILEIKETPSINRQVAHNCTQGPSEHTLSARNFTYYATSQVSK